MYHIVTNSIAVFMYVDTHAYATKVKMMPVLVSGCGCDMDIQRMVVHFIVALNSTIILQIPT